MFRMLSIASLLACAGICCGQSVGVYYELSFTEVDAATGEPVAHPNGIVEPGEGALISLSVAFTPPAGTIINAPYLPPDVWRMRAFRGGMFPDFLVSASPHGTGEWRHLYITPGWGTTGTPSPDGSMVEWIGLFQFAATADQRNPAEGVWRGVWVPEHFTSRVVKFDFNSRNITLVASSSIWLRDEGPPEEFRLDWPQYALNYSVLVEVGPGPPPPCYPNCTGSTTEPILTVDDFTCFINEFSVASTLPVNQQIEHYANCDGSTAPPILTVDDFTCFINAFAQGCR